MIKIMLPYGSADTSTLVAKAASGKTAARLLSIYGQGDVTQLVAKSQKASDRSAALAAKASGGKGYRHAGERRRVVRLNAG